MCTKTNQYTNTTISCQAVTSLSIPSFSTTATVANIDPTTIIATTSTAIATIEAKSATFSTPIASLVRTYLIEDRYSSTKGIQESTPTITNTILDNSTLQTTQMSLITTHTSFQLLTHTSVPISTKVGTLKLTKSTSATKSIKLSLITKYITTSSISLSYLTIEPYSFSMTFTITIISRLIINSCVIVYLITELKNRKHRKHRKHRKAASTMSAQSDLMEGV